MPASIEEQLHLALRLLVTLPVRREAAASARAIAQDLGISSRRARRCLRAIRRSGFQIEETVEADDQGRYACHYYLGPASRDLLDRLLTPPQSR